jgi:hypothetical protein
MLSAWRNEPGPLSFVLVTVMVSALASTVSVQSSTAAMPADPKYDVILIFISIRELPRALFRRSAFW